MWVTRLVTSHWCQVDSYHPNDSSQVPKTHVSLTNEHEEHLSQTRSKSKFCAVPFSVAISLHCKLQGLLAISKPRKSITPLQSLLNIYDQATL